MRPRTARPPAKATGPGAPRARAPRPLSAAVPSLRSGGPESRPQSSCPSALHLPSPPALSTDTTRDTPEFDSLSNPRSRSASLAPAPATPDPDPGPASGGPECPAIRVHRGSDAPAGAVPAAAVLPEPPAVAGAPPPEAALRRASGASSRPATSAPRPSVAAEAPRDGPGDAVARRASVARDAAAAQRAAVARRASTTGRAAALRRASAAGAPRCALPGAAEAAPPPPPPPPWARTDHAAPLHPTEYLTTAEGVHFRPNMSHMVPFPHLAKPSPQVPPPALRAARAPPHLIPVGRGGGGGLYGVEFLCAPFVLNLFGVVKGIRWAVPVLSCTMPKDLVDDNQFPTEVAEVLRWCFLICSVPVAFDGVTVDAPGKSSRK